MLGKILKLFVGDKSKKDLKTITPIIDQIHSFEDEISKLTNDDLRNQTLLFKDQIKSSVSEIDKKIEELKTELEKIKDFDKKESLFLEIDKLNEDAYKVNETTLNEILPKAFAVVKETAKRFVENNEVIVKANEYDLELSVEKDYVNVAKDISLSSKYLDIVSSSRIKVTSSNVFTSSDTPSSACCSEPADLSRTRMHTLRQV